MALQADPEIPTDLKALRQLVLALFQELEAKDRELGHLTAQLQWLRHRLFGRSSEKLDSNQMLLELGSWLAAQPAEPAPAAAPEPAAEPNRMARKGHGRGRLPKTLTRHRTEYHPSSTDLVCRECCTELKRIGEEVSEQLEYVPASFFVLEHARIKYACPDCQGNVVLGSLPVQPIDKGLPGPGLLAHVLTSKYCDHLPLNRLEGIFERHGVELSRSTLCDWVAAATRRLEPLVAVMKSEVLASRKIHTDDTTVPVLDQGKKNRGKTKTGRLWVYVGDDDHEHIVFDYTPDRTRDGPLCFLEGYQGYLQADAYPGYDVMYAKKGMIEVACWAHTRRKFFDAMKGGAPKARIALAYIRELYEIERRARDLTAQDRCALRRAEAKPQLATFKAWLDAEALTALPKSPIGRAIHYAREQWQALLRYLEDGILEIDNNRAERALRRVAVGRKNWMFAGSDEGGRRAAIAYSLIASCAALNLDPYRYLRDVLARLATASPADLIHLTPQAWKAATDAAAVAAAA